jgi:hypothetical protein
VDFGDSGRRQTQLGDQARPIWRVPCLQPAAINGLNFFFLLGQKSQKIIVPDAK